MNNATIPTIESLGIPSSVTQQQKEVILKPFVSMNEFTGGGALNLRRAVKYWLKTLKNDLGASPAVLEKTETAWGEISS